MDHVYQFLKKWLLTFLLRCIIIEGKQEENGMTKKWLCGLLCLVFAIAPSCAVFTESVTSGEISVSETQSTEEEQGVLTITSGEGEVYPYCDQIKQWLSSPYGTDVVEYYFSTDNQAQGIALAWEYTGSDVEAVRLTYGKKGSKESERIAVSLDADVREYALYNLYKATEYDWSVEITLSSGAVLTESASFKTTDLGPRTLYFTDIYNTRDVGGYVTENGKMTKQGMMLRGSEVPSYLRAVTREQLQPFGIKTDLDLRGYGEESGFRQESAIPNAKLKYVMTIGYMGAFRSTEHYKEIFSFMADESNYPMYVHCTAGADRTGTVIFLLNALLGVPEEVLIRDYEFTSFSKWGIRSQNLDTEYGPAFQEFLTALKAYSGETLADKTEAYMLSIGVTQTEIDNIRAIMLEE